MKKPRSIKKIGRGGKRRTLGWTLLTLGLLVAGVWVASRWWLFGWQQGDSFVYAYYGLLNGGTEDGYEVRESPWVFERRERNPGFYWYLVNDEENPFVVKSTSLFIASYETRTFDKYEWYVVLWPIPLLLWIPATLLLRSGILARRRAMSNACPKCGYSLAGLAADAACPECGKVMTKA